MCNVIALLRMPLTRRLVPLALAVLIAAATIEMIRRRKLLEEYATFWMVSSGLLLVVAIVPDIVIWLQELLRINYLAIVLIGGLGMVALVLMHFAVIATRYAAQIRRLSQRQALLELELERLRGDRAPGRAGEGRA